MLDLRLWIAQGFGVGRMPFAPGTFGSLLGIGWFALLVASGKLWVFVAGAVLGIALSVWFCGEGEKILKQRDPGSIVLDEIVAIPVCFFGWVFMHYRISGGMPTLEKLLSGWIVVLAGFALFRFFDIVKPWPVRQSQSLSGGWGVTVDDLLAAVYVNVALVAATLAGLK